MESLSSLVRRSETPDENTPAGLSPVPGMFWPLLCMYIYNICLYAGRAADPSPPATGFVGLRRGGWAKAGEVDGPTSRARVLTLSVEEVPYPRVDPYPSPPLFFMTSFSTR